MTDRSVPVPDPAGPIHRTRSSPLLRRHLRVSPWSWTVGTVALLVALPILVVVSRVFLPSDGVWAHLAATVLDDYVRNSVLLTLGVVTVASSLGVITAWKAYPFASGAINIS
ncbi:hypothetical protein [Roseospira visakhapatnamensis]|uniref:ABC-type Fe3+ transport system permease subunit n=1 Tax=Roseospira visakhapatnamensis TaxID=390880 RepID=A0A7W6RHI3_9PROT|nr:hypothetical protein [Roseospira visakhapatnamensis]MBB4267988.1 ABC-type Fe3+ transport system permease subunit [Roseospira visakhapatnamensis]